MKESTQTNGARPDLPLRLEWLEPDQLAEHPKNWKTHPDSQVAGLSAVVRKVGWAGALLYNERTHRLIDGHARRKLGAELCVDGKVPVLVGSWSEDDEGLILATLDPLGAMAETNDEDYQALLATLESDQDGLNDLLERLLGEVDESNLETASSDHSPPVDKAEEFLAKWQVEPGQVWQAGSHRVMCGDCTDRSDVDRLMAGAKAKLLCTDPPYGISLDLSQTHEASQLARGNPGGSFRTFAPIENDNLRGDDLEKFLESFLRISLSFLEDHSAIYLFHPSMDEALAFKNAMDVLGILRHRQIVWVKPAFIFGRGDYHWQHELCSYGWVRGKRPPFYGKRNQGTIWTTDVGGGIIRAEQYHPTEKPVELFQAPIQNHLKAGELAYEPFAGSGAQFEAAEAAGGVCYGMDVEPKYVAVTLERLVRMGLAPVLARAV